MFRFYPARFAIAAPAVMNRSEGSFDTEVSERSWFPKKPYDVWLIIGHSLRLLLTFLSRLEQLLPNLNLPINPDYNIVV